MDTRIVRTMEELKSNGWHILLHEAKTDWWIDEAYELHSLWNPSERVIYLTLNVAPDVTSNRRKGENIVSLSISKFIATSRFSEDPVTFYLSELDAAGIKRVVGIANELRNTG